MEWRFGDRAIYLYFDAYIRGVLSDEIDEWKKTKARRTAWHNPHESYVRISAVSFAEKWTKLPNFEAKLKW